MTVKTTRINPPRAAWPALAACGALVVLIILLVVVLVRAGSLAAATPDPVIILGTSTPTAAPTAQTVGLARAIIAYDAPGGNAIGGIEPGRQYTVVARAGIDWLQLDVAGSGLVWTQIDQVDGVDVAALPDLAPPTAPPVAQQPAQPQGDSATVSNAGGGQVYPTPDADGNICQDGRCWNVNAPSVVYVADPRTLATPTPAAAVAAGDQPSSGLPQPGEPGFKESFRDPNDAATDASFQEPAKPNPFIGCVTQACRKQFGRP